MSRLCCDNCVSLISHFDLAVCIENALTLCSHTLLSHSAAGCCICDAACVSSVCTCMYICLSGLLGTGESRTGIQSRGGLVYDAKIIREDRSSRLRTAAHQQTPRTEGGFSQGQYDAAMGRRSLSLFIGVCVCMLSDGGL